MGHVAAALILMLAASSAVGQDIDPPRLIVPRLAQPPTIDGTVAAGEWDRAGAATGFFGFLDQQLAERQPVVFMGYDDAHLYLCIVVPIRRGMAPVAAVTQRDGQVYREDAVEAMLLPPDGKLRHVIVNAIGTVYDAVAGDKSFDGDFRIAAGRARERHLPDALHDSFEAYWGVEMALPFAEWDAPVPQPGDQWRVNFAVDGSEPRMLAPTFDSFLDTARFGVLRFVGGDEPFAAIASLGAPRAGRVNLGGWLINPTASDVQYRIAVRASQYGTHTVEQTGFDEIIGAEARAEVVIDVPAGGREAVRLSRQMDDARFDRLELNVALIDEPAQVQQQWAYAVRLPFRVVVENVPSRRQARLDIDATQVSELADDAVARWQIVDTELHGDVPLDRGRAEATVDYASLEPGAYTLQIALSAGGETITTIDRALVHPGELAWMHNNIGKAPRVLRPFEPLTYDGDTVHAWQRAMTFNHASIVPSQMTGGDEPLLAEPARLVIEVGGERVAFPLDAIEWDQQDDHRGAFRITGSAAGFTLSGSGWVEYDGLMWFEIELQSDAGPRTIDSLTIELPMRREHAQLYHGVPDRSLTGPIGDEPLAFAFQYYFWLGSPRRGLGFAVESLENFHPYDGRHMYDVIPQGDVVLWRVRLISEPVERQSLRYAFGLQATPVKPLPPESHSWVVGNYDTNGKSLWRSPYREAMEMAVIWNKGAQRYMQAFCDPMGVDTAKLRPIVERIEAAGAASLIYFAPMQFSEGAQPEHGWFAHEWMIKPRSAWNVTTHESVQVRASAQSSFVDFLLFGLQRTAAESGATGFYFDGGMPVADMNAAHGAGWVDETGKRHPTYPLLAIRDFTKRVAVMLAEQADARGEPADDPRPQYHVWSHVSGAVCPMTHSFATNLLCGEWFKAPLKSGQLYGDMLTRDTFRPRYLSQPWGIPNTFLSICTARPDATAAQTEAILGHILPQGGPLFVRYLDGDIWPPIVDAMLAFDTRTARFTPAWEDSPVLVIDAPPNVLMGTWDRDGDVLLVIGNIGDEPASVTLQGRGAALRWSWVYPSDEPLAAQSTWTMGVPAHSVRVARLSP